MEMTGEQLIGAPRERVWQALNDPEVLKRCIPGGESIERIAENEYRVAMTAAVGPVKAKFTGKLALADIVAPTSYTISFEGSGGAAGFGKGGAKVALAPEGTATRLRYTATAQVGGKLAQVGARLIDGVAKKMADEFFKRFNEAVAGPAAAPVAEKPAAETGAPQSGPWLGGTYAFIAAFVVTLLVMAVVA